MRQLRGLQGRPLRTAAVGALATATATAAAAAALAVAPGAAVASSTTVTTASGVVTHGSIKTTDDTTGWLLTCPLSHRLADDPIVLPGQPGASHLHDFTGNASTNAYSTPASMESLANTVPAASFNGSATAAGTSCDLPTYAPGTAGDTGAYWRPVVYANGQPLTPTVKDQLYYRAKPLFGTGFRPVPQDARIIVGDHMATSVQDNDALRDGHLYWECDGTSSTHYQLPPNRCSSRSILENVVFPSCWDGLPMDHTGPLHSDDNHFAYAVGSTCPAGFPVKMPQLSEKFKYDNVPTGAVLQLSGDPGGTGMGMPALAPAYTAHADFWNTWQPAAMQYLVDRCINAQLSCGTNPLTPLG